MVSRKYKSQNKIIDDNNIIVGKELIGDNVIISVIDVKKINHDNDKFSIIIITNFTDLNLKLITRIKDSSILNILYNNYDELLYNTCLFMIKQNMKCRIVEYVEASVDYNVITDLWPYNMNGKIKHFESWNRLENKIVDTIEITKKKLIKLTNEYKEYSRRNLN